MKCRICGKKFDPADLALVFLHEHDNEINPSKAIGIKGKQRNYESIDSCALCGCSPSECQCN